MSEAKWQEVYKVQTAAITELEQRIAEIEAERDRRMNEMTMAPYKGVCFHCGHDHDIPLVEPTALANSGVKETKEALKYAVEEIKELEQRIAELEAQLTDAHKWFKVIRNYYGISAWQAYENRLKEIDK